MIQVRVKGWGSGGPQFEYWECYHQLYSKEIGILVDLEENILTFIKRIHNKANTQKRLCGGIKITKKQKNLHDECFLFLRPSEESSVGSADVSAGDEQLPFWSCGEVLLSLSSELSDKDVSSQSFNKRSSLCTCWSLYTRAINCMREVDLLKKIWNTWFQYVYF